MPTDQKKKRRGLASRQRIKTTLLDGSRVLIRPITPADKAKVAAAFAGMSEESRLFRFGVVRQSMSERELAFLTEIDYVNHFAWGAEGVSQPGSPGIGAARYIRDPDDPGTADIHITVVDGYQGVGLGTVLLFLLAESAMENCIQNLRARVLSENKRALSLLGRLGAELRLDGHYRIGTIQLPLTARSARVNWPG